ncbi:MAG: C10 family peptidase [Duncaniella sp.]|nr:C10 family peptidase [Duncaniella sp.]
MEREEILPLTKTQWGQQAPFFYDTPTTNGEHCKTGCVATAMSQLIYYHQYPHKGKDGTYSYMTGAHGDISFNFSDNTFDYELMKAIYDRTETAEDASAKEVSKLMFAAGVTVNMSYGLTESAGQFGSVSNSFREWFLYPDEGIKQVSRDYFTHEEWSDLIYDELANKRPVIYMGGNGSSSHVFLCDGYKDGEFHMNWGWYGECNGYFSLIDLQTYVPSQGKVWSLNSTQSIVRGIHAPGAEVPSPLVTALNFDCSDNSFILTSASISAANKSVVLGVKAIDSEGHELLIWADEETELKRSSSSVTFNLSQLTLPDGVYTLRPVLKLPDDDAATFYNVYCNLNNNRYLTVKIENNAIVSAKGGTDAEVNVSISNFKPNSPLIYGEVLNRSFTVFAENTGNVNITRIKQWFYEPGTDIRVDAYENSYTVSLSSGSAQTITLALPSNLPAGQYEMQLIDPNNNLLGSRIPITYYNNADAITIGDSPFRFLALDTPSVSTLASDSENYGEAIMFKPSSTNFTAPSEFTIPEVVEINGKTYNVTEIGPQLAMNHAEITSLTIPSTVKNIASGAFNGCTSLNNITTNAAIPPTLTSTSFASAIKPTAKVTVPSGALTAYMEDEQWSQFSNLVEGETEGEDGLNMSPFSIVKGCTKDVSLSLISSATYYGFQFEMELPEGLAIIGTDGVQASPATSGFSVNYKELSNGKYMIVVFDVGGKSIPTGTNNILEITFQASETFNGGKIKISNVIFSTDGDNDCHKDVNFSDLELEVTPSSDVSTSIEQLDEIVDNDPVTIFNISGVKVATAKSLTEINLAPGIYIVKKGNEYNKISIR